MMESSVSSLFRNKKILILGFGKEGRSTLKFLQKFRNWSQVTIADKNPSLNINDLDQYEKKISFVLGGGYLDRIDHYDLIFKSPGISNRLLKNRIDRNKITSQTEFFLSVFRDQIIGITGTKGKSTTSSLIFSILRNAGKRTLLVGNIGIPPLDYFEQITPETNLVYEMSAHQLEGIQISPHIAVFLNIFEEHLDHYLGMEQYRSAKSNIFKHQGEGDWVFINSDNQKLLSDLSAYCPDSIKIPFPADENDGRGLFSLAENKIMSRINNRTEVYDFTARIGLPGNHNMKNIMAAVGVAGLLDVGPSVIQETVNAFKGLEHRLEYVGKVKGIHFYNDSIATIPEATMEAVKTLKKVDFLILGGMDRGVNFGPLIEFLISTPVGIIALTGDAGERLKTMLSGKFPADRLFPIKSFDELPDLIRNYAPQNGICLLSPAAASYGMFRNFEDRGNRFKEMIKNL